MSVFSSVFLYIFVSRVIVDWWLRQLRAGAARVGAVFVFVSVFVSVFLSVFVSVFVSVFSSVFLYIFVSRVIVDWWLRQLRAGAARVGAASGDVGIKR